LLGSVHFYGREFAIDSRVLVPRPETERLVDVTLAFMAHRDHTACRVLDVGTGSGVLACTLAAEIPSALVDATDRSADALALAAANARALGVGERCRFHLGNLAEPVTGVRYDIVVANLPYVPTADIPPAPDPLAFEPRMALDGGPDGLRHYAALVPALPRLLAPGGIALLEAAPHQMDALRRLAARAFAGAEVAIGRDLAGLERFAVVSSPPG
jgi:release factor glutamine methyltransferase